VNGFYDGVAVPVAGESIVYAGLSGFAAAKSTTAANGLYIANVCAAGLIPQGACPTPRTLMTWAGSSGPVAADRAGNVFVAASFYGKDPSDVICTVSRAAVDSGAAAPSTCTTGIASTTGTGVEQVAAGLRAGAASGWALVKLAEYGGKTSAYAQKYNGATALGEGAKIADAITYGSNAESFSVINDDNGGLWITVNSATGGGGVLLELAERP
jgi:hypothetical protein